MRLNVTKLLLTAALCIVSAAAAFAQPGGQMICSNNQGEPGNCQPPRGIYSTISGGILPPGIHSLITQGQSTFNCIGPPNTCCPTPLMPAGWTGNGIHPLFGPVMWSFVIPSTCPPSTITPNFPPACFPATGDLYFNVTGTLGSVPGVFTSAVCIHVRSTNITSCNPFRCETFTLVNGPIPFNDGAGNFAFNLDNLIVVLNN
jgi:hypothetical protein